MALNAEDIFALFRETDRKFQETDRLVKELAAQSKETDRKFQETDRKFQDTDRLVKETDQIVKELAAQSKETDQIVKELAAQSKETDQIVKELAAQSKETDRKFQDTDRLVKETDQIVKELAVQSKETDRKFQDTDRKIKALAKNLGDIGNRLGRFVEEMIRPAVIQLFNARGIEVHEIMGNVSGKREGLVAEIDLLAIDTTEAVAVEVKSDLCIADVQRHLERMGRFKQIFVHYRDLQVYGAVAGMVVSHEVARYAERQGLFVLYPSGEHITLANAPEFTPRRW